ncbi:MAG: (d)CMP kinase [Lachnospiraceae bacterium]|nr:(d)CMP kinase [Lachnospiraceae bacterium]MBO5326109.1 (d)CMP kinase [Lachnospiraceae bacterium]
MAFNVAIDGPAGAGKSTIAKSVAAELNFIYVDTGAMYRAIALYLIRNGIKADENAKISEKCKEAQVSIQYVDGKQVVLLNGEDVNPYIRTEEVGNMASASSTNPDVRAQLLDLQRDLAAKNDVIMDGRDIGTNILPGAQVKIYLTASIEVRAKRRYNELIAKGMECDLKEIEKDIAERDERDMNREIAPLKQAEDAVFLDTSDMGIEEVKNTIIDLIRSKQ